MFNYIIFKEVSFIILNQYILSYFALHRLYEFSPIISKRIFVSE